VLAVETNAQTDRQTDRQTDGWTDRWQWMSISVESWHRSILVIRRHGCFLPTAASHTHTHTHTCMHALTLTEYSDTWGCTDHLSNILLLQLQTVPVSMNFKINLDGIKLNQHDKYLGQRQFQFKS